MAEYIDREAAIRTLRESAVAKYPLSFSSGILAAADELQKMPAADVVPVVHGRWIDMQEDDSTEGMWRCSVCGSDRYFDIMTPTECGCYYCPNCGARMDENA